MTLLLRHSGLRIRDGATLERARVKGGKLFLYTQKTGTPGWVPLPPAVIAALEQVPNENERYFFWSETATRRRPSRIGRGASPPSSARRSWACARGRPEPRRKSEIGGRLLSIRRSTTRLGREKDAQDRTCSLRILRDRLPSSATNGFHQGWSNLSSIIMPA